MPGEWTAQLHRLQEKIKAYKAKEVHLKKLMDQARRPDLDPDFDSDTYASFLTEDNYTQQF